MEAIALAATAAAAVVIVEVATVVVAIVIAIAVIAAVVGVGVVGVVELVSWMKVRQVAFPIGLGPCPYPSSAFGGIYPSPGPAPLLQRNKKQRKRIRDSRLCT